MKHTYHLQEIPHFLTVKFLNKLSQLKNNFEVHQMSIDSYFGPPALHFGVEILLLLPLVHPFTFLCISMMRSNGHLVVWLMEIDSVCCGPTRVCCGPTNDLRNSHSSSKLSMPWMKDRYRFPTFTDKP
jgi:hypothetical protein